MLLAIAALTAMACSCYYWTSDAHRISMFRAHKSEYETLLNMLQHDRGLKFINSGLSVPEDPGIIGISPRRIAEYRRYMSKIGSAAIYYEPSVGSAVFTSGTVGAPVIVYFPMQSAAAAEKYGVPLDRPPAQSFHIEGNWCLSFGEVSLNTIVLLSFQSILNAKHAPIT